jgi:hypothetical protein
MAAVLIGPHHQNNNNKVDICAFLRLYAAQIGIVFTDVSGNF